MSTHGLTVEGATTPRHEEILTDAAKAFVAELHRRFDGRRRELLAQREERQEALESRDGLRFLPETEEVRRGDWKVAPTPDDLQRRWVEITGPVERKMMINAFNSGADCFMADFEDSSSPTWSNNIDGQVNLYDAVRREIELVTEDKEYRLGDDTATLLVRPRGWHLLEKHVTVDGEPISASLFDFGLHFFHNARELLERGSGPYFYLPKLESHLEARLWNDVFVHAQEALGIPHGSIRATVLVETLPAAFEMDEILYELRDHSAGLNAGRWDYIFSAIRKFPHRDETFPNRIQVSMTVPFMRAYTELLVKTCHGRGAHAMGGMSAYIPSRRDAEANEKALEEVRQDKLREARDGFDGTWVAHPDLVPVAREVFERYMGDRPHQKDKLREDVDVSADDLQTFTIEGGTVTEEGFRNNVSVALQYLSAWLAGTGAVAIFNLMEDAATAEISRSQLWQWLHHSARLENGETVDRQLYERIRDEETEKLREIDNGHLDDAVELLDGLVLPEGFEPFLTLPAYEKLNAIHDRR